MSNKFNLDSEQKSSKNSLLTQTQNKISSYNLNDISAYKINFENEENREYYIYLQNNLKKLWTIREELNNQIEVLNLQVSEFSNEIKEFFQ